MKKFIWTKIHAKKKFSGVISDRLIEPKLSWVLRSTEYGLVTKPELDSCIKAVKKVLPKKQTIVYSHIRPTIPKTSKPIGVRMGKGKGNRVLYNVTLIKPGKIILEVKGKGFPLLFKNSLRAGKLKLSIKTNIVSLING